MFHVSLARILNKMANIAKDPRRSLYLTETKSWKWEEEGGEHVSRKTQATARGVGKNTT